MNLRTQIFATAIVLAVVSEAGSATITSLTRLDGGPVPWLRHSADQFNPTFSRFSQVWRDHTFYYDSVPSYLIGADQILTTSRQDKLDPDFQLQLALATPATVYLLIDDKVPSVANEMPWVSTMGFTDTGDQAVIRVSADSIFTTASIYSGRFPAGNLVLLQQNDTNNNSSMYLVAAVPEPASVLLMLFGPALWFCWRLRRASILSAVVFLSVPALGHAAILVMPGDFIESFDFPPFATEWSTRITGIGAGSSAITSNATMDAAVQQLSAADIDAPLPPTANLPPSSSAAAQYNTSGDFVQTYSDTAAASLLMATLYNASDADAGGLIVSYELSAYSPVAIAEEIPGHRVYYSTTGLPNSWNPVGNVAPSLPGPSPGWTQLEFNVGTWANGANLFLLWVDDNAAASEAGGETAYAIDNIFFTAVPVPEPSTLILGASGLVLVLALQRRRLRFTAL